MKKKIKKLNPVFSRAERIEYVSNERCLLWNFVEDLEEMISFADNRDLAYTIFMTIGERYGFLAK